MRSGRQAQWVVGEFSGRVDAVRVLGPPRLVPIADWGREVISGCRAGNDGLISENEEGVETPETREAEMEGRCQQLRNKRDAQLTA